ncbi:MAG TPA: hypothetical protein VG870_08705 [Chitinophagaceae bacterium]|nr:hypothetical protein [Chitinophagaceae bacterium]
MENEYSSRYRNYSFEDLLDILEHASDYQPDAVRAALRELESRNIGLQNPEVIPAAAADSRADAGKAPPGTALRGRFPHWLRASLVPPNPSLPHTSVRWAAITLGCLLLFFFSGDLNSARALLQHPGGLAGAGLYRQLVAWVLVPWGIYLVCKSRPLGWYLLMFWLCWQATGILVSLREGWTTKATERPGLPGMAQPDYLTQVFLLIVLATHLVFWNRAIVSRTLGIRPPLRALVILAAILIALLTGFS